MLSSIVCFFLNPVGFSLKRRNSLEKVFNLLFITDLNNLRKQLKIVIGRSFWDQFVSLCFYKMDQFTANQVSGTIPDLKIRLNRSTYCSGPGVQNVVL